MIGDAFYVLLLVWIVYVGLQLRAEFDRLQRGKRLTSEREGGSSRLPSLSGARRVRRGTADLSPARRVPDPKPQGRPER